MAGRRVPFVPAAAESLSRTDRIREAKFAADGERAGVMGK